MQQSPSCVAFYHLQLGKNEQVHSYKHGTLPCSVAFAISQIHHTALLQHHAAVINQLFSCLTGPSTHCKTHLFSKSLAL